MSALTRSYYSSCRTNQSPAPNGPVTARSVSSRVSTREHEQWALPGGYAYPVEGDSSQETHRANELSSPVWCGREDAMSTSRSGWVCEVAGGIRHLVAHLVDRVACTAERVAQSKMNAVERFV